MKISLKNFSYRIPGGAKALFELPSFEIPKAQKILLKGPSGCGKSSFLHAIAGIMSTATGKVFYNEEDLLSKSPQERAHFRALNLALIFQKLSLIPHFSVLENLLIEREDPLRARKLLEKFGLNNKEDILVERLSWGETQRVAIARALMKDFMVLLADEPTSSLDDAMTELVMKELIFQSKGRIFVCVSHDHRIEKYFDRVLTLTQMKTPSEVTT
jgi:putative ABC transport system ATP-binding protein